MVGLSYFLWAWVWCGFGVLGLEGELKVRVTRREEAQVALLNKDQWGGGICPSFRAKESMQLKIPLPLILQDRPLRLLARGLLQGWDSVWAENQSSSQAPPLHFSSFLPSLALSSLFSKKEGSSSQSSPPAVPLRDIHPPTACPGPQDHTCE